MGHGDPGHDRQAGRKGDPIRDVVLEAVGSRRLEFHHRLVTAPFRSWPLGGWLLGTLWMLGCGTETGPDPDPDPTNLCTEMFRWMSVEPRVIDPDSGGDVSVSLVFPSCVPTASLAAGSGALPFEAVDDTTARLTAPTQQLLAGRSPGDLHHFLGFIDLFDAAGLRYVRFNGFANVRTDQVEEVAVVAVAPDAQASAYVVNLQVDRPFTGTESDPAVARRFYELFPDDYQFLAIVNAAEVGANRTHRLIRNDVAGIGLFPTDNGSTYGSASRLEGLIHFPISTLFDLAGPGATHEIGHRWVNFFAGSELGPGSPHWPISDLADNVMGFNLPGSSVGGSLLGQLVQTAPGVFLLDCSAGPSLAYADLTLYAMGLLPPDSVGVHTVFGGQAQSLACGSIWQGASTQVSIDDVVTLNGPRAPAWPGAPTEFRLATVVLSAGRLLTSGEMAFFDHMAARGESTAQVPFSSGFLTGDAKPFFVATGGRATLITRR